MANSPLPDGIVWDDEAATTQPGAKTLVSNQQPPLPEGITWDKTPTKKSTAYLSVYRDKKALFDLIDREAERQGIPKDLAHAIVKQESNYSPGAISKAGAKGLMQLMDGTSRDVGVYNPYNPEENVRGGLTYLNRLLKKYKGNTQYALAAYNMGPGAFDLFLNGKRGLPSETLNYVRNITKNLHGNLGGDIRTTGQKIVGAALPYAKPVIEMGGLAGGGVVGSSLGPLGSVAGAGLGYGIAKELTGQLEEYAGEKYAQELPERLLEAGGNVAEGAMLEAGGQMVGPLLRVSGLKALVPGTTEAVDASAGRLLASQTGKSPIYTQNAAESEQIAQQVPGWNPSVGARRNDPGLIKLQRSLEANPGVAADLMAQNRTANQKALRDYLENQFSGTETIDDVINALQLRKAGLERQEAIATGNVADSYTNLPRVTDQATGRRAVSEIESQRLPAKSDVNKLYQQVGNDPVPVSETVKVSDELKADFRPGDEIVYPSTAIKRIERATTDIDPATKTVTQKAGVGFQDLHSLRKDIGRQIRNATTGANPNNELAMKLHRLKDAIDADIEAGMGANNKYVAARNAYKEYAERFRSGAVGKTLQRGQEFSGLHTPDALIGKRFFTPDGADDLIRAIGKDNAAIVMEGHAANDLAKSMAVNPATGEINGKALNGWLKKNREVLDKYGITREFESVEVAQATLDAVKNEQVAFGKSVAGTILGSDVNSAIKNAMQGKKSTAKAMQDLIAQLGGNKEAIVGLRNAFKDFMISEAEATAKNIADDLILKPSGIIKAMKKYEPAMNVLYKDAPKQLQALKRVQKAIEIQSRAFQSPIGGGSDTTEKIVMSTMQRLLMWVPGGNLTARIGRVGLGLIAKMGEKKVANLLARAMYDPDLAMILTNFGKKTLQPKVVERKLSDYVARYGLYELNKLREE